MSGKSRHDREQRQTAAARRALASLPGPVRQHIGARPEPPERPDIPDVPEWPPRQAGNQRPMTIDERLAQAKATVEQLDKTLMHLRKKSEEVEKQLLKALGAHEMLAELKRDGFTSAHSDAPQSPPDEARAETRADPPPGTGDDPREPESEENDARDEGEEEPNE